MPTKTNRPKTTAVQNTGLRGASPRQVRRGRGGGGGEEGGGGVGSAGGSGGVGEASPESSMNRPTY